MKRLLIPAAFMLAAACSKSGDKPNITLPGNPSVYIGKSEAGAEILGGHSTSFTVQVDLTNAKTIAYVNLVDETNPITAEAIKPDKTGPWVMFDRQHIYEGNTDVYHLYVKLTDSSSFNSATYKCH